MTFESSIPQDPQEDTRDLVSPPASTAANSPTGTNKTWAYSGKALRAQMILFIVLTVALLSLIPLFGDFLTIPSGVVIVLLWLYHAAIYYYRTMTISYRLGDFNLYYDHGFLNRTTDTMEIINIEDMQVTQTLWDRLINGGVGTVRLYNKTDRTHSGEFTMRGLENPRTVLEEIDRVRQERRGKRTMIQV